MMKKIVKRLNNPSETHVGFIVRSHPVRGIYIRACHRLRAGLGHAADLRGRGQNRFW